MYTENLHILGQPKKKICEYCGRHAHPFTTKCQHNDLTSRIRNLLDRNALMPQLIEQNKELREMALTFEAQFDNIAKTLLLCEQVVMEEPNGKDIWNKFTDRMEKQWPKKTSSPGTEEITKNSNQESTIPSATESKPSTEMMISGETTVADSLLSIRNATLAEIAPPLSIT